MIIFLLIIYFKGGSIEPVEVLFKDKAQCASYANYKNSYNKPENVKEFRCLEFKESK